MPYNHFWYHVGVCTLAIMAVLIAIMVSIEVYRYGICSDPDRYDKCKRINTKLYTIALILLLVNVGALMISLSLT
jgi:hypothetical protein